MKNKMNNKPHLNTMLPIIKELKMNRILLTLILGLFLISFISADCSLPPSKIGDSIQLTQTCSNCTYINLTKIVYPNQSIALLGEYSMDANGTNYNYSYTPNTLGTYYYTTKGDLNGIVTIQTCSFDVTPSGTSDNLGLYLILIGIVYLIGFFGFFGKNLWVSALGGIGMLTLGVYFIGEGVIIYRDYLTNAVAYLTIGLGAIFTLVPIIEFIVQELD